MNTIYNEYNTNGFRLLNSEIGNDRKSKGDNKNGISSFRLLNSEIGNDLRERRANEKINS